MIKQEWKNILKNHWIQIVLVALILIPSIYTVVFLGSMWDPYGNSGDLPVAVVNKDKAVEYNDKKLDVGDQLVKKLKDNDFDVENIISPLNRVLRGMLYSPVKLEGDYTNFILEKVNHKTEIPLEKMKDLISLEIIPEILDNIKNNLKNQTDGIIKTLDEKEESLINDISSSIKEDAEELKKQLENKKEYEELYKQAVLGIEEIRDNI